MNNLMKLKHCFKSRSGSKVSVEVLAIPSPQVGVRMPRVSHPHLPLLMLKNEQCCAVVTRYQLAALKNLIEHGAPLAVEWVVVSKRRYCASECMEEILKCLVHWGGPQMVTVSPGLTWRASFSLSRMMVVLLYRPQLNTSTSTIQKWRYGRTSRTRVTTASIVFISVNPLECGIKFFCIHPYDESSAAHLSS